MTITKGRERMYTVKNVLFEQLKTIPKRVMVLGILYFFFPFLCLCGMGIPEVRNVLLSGPELLDNIVQALLVGGLILWAPAGFIFLIVTRKRGVGAYKYYPNFRMTVVLKSKPPLILNPNRERYFVSFGIRQITTPRTNNLLKNFNTTTLPRFCYMSGIRRLPLYRAAKTLYSLQLDSLQERLFPRIPKS